jgi:AmmeMemoRadiSam system protein B
MGYQTRDTIDDLARGLSSAMSGRAVLLVASTDLSHYYDAATAARLDSRVIEHVTMFDVTGLQNALDAFPQHACGGGPAVSVMQAARSLGAQHARVLKYADSGDVSGDKDAVVGYLAAAFGNLSSHP